MFRYHVPHEVTSETGPTNQLHTTPARRAAMRILMAGQVPRRVPARNRETRISVPSPPRFEGSGVAGGPRGHAHSAGAIHQDHRQHIGVRHRSGVDHPRRGRLQHHRLRPRPPAGAIWVSNVPGRNSIAVAELTMGLILAVDRTHTGQRDGYPPEAVAKEGIRQISRVVGKDPGHCGKWVGSASRWPDAPTDSA